MSEQLADHRLNPEEECKDSELSARLTHFQTQLSPTLRRTFQLRDLDGFSIKETARILGIPSGTVKTRSARARQKLKDLMRRSLKPRSRSLRDRALVGTRQLRTAALEVEEQMIGRAHIPVLGAKADRYASREDFRRIFDEDPIGLCQLSFPHRQSREGAAVLCMRF